MYMCAGCTVHMHAKHLHCLLVNWDGFRDYESGIYAYTWCVGNTTATCNILDYQTIPPLLHSSQAWTNVGLFNMDNEILQDGVYYLSVQVNRISLQSA